MTGTDAVTPTPHEPPTDSTDAWRRLHDDAVSRLEAWVAPDEQQESLRLEFLEHLREHPDAMRKSGPPAHLTGSVVVLDEQGDSVLLTLHRRARAWFQFGGHFEPGDASVWHAAMREAREESGMADISPFPDIVQLDRHVLVGDFGHCREHLDIRFAAVAPPASSAAVSAESIDVRWWSVDALPEGSREDLLPLVTAARRATHR
ncbi:NUDIX hydrolase [Terrabacter aerolatus]|uniref:NUDIX hydrolase n=1 Tax=Terrabacter aerolatus TaxID=422442 RepID=A0A512D1P5_9MICO|nr:NUDIX domain-containing protein [Terrabacter aerolatus]GEO30388.1 NUDIX hydrolase [Terrabacter aerolatus]